MDVYGNCGALNTRFCASKVFPRKLNSLIEYLGNEDYYWLYNETATVGDISQYDCAFVAKAKAILIPKEFSL